MADKGTKKNWFVRHKVITAILALIVLIVLVNSTSDKKSTGSKDKATSSSSSSTDKAAAPAETFAFDDGKHEVGKDIKAGTYRTKGGDGSNFGCYWARLSGFSGELDEIIANNGSYTNGSQVITIADTDKGFETRGCGKWYAELDQVTKSKTTFGDGMLIMGTDIEPGTYKNSGAKDQYSCYWVRLNGFSGKFEDIITNEIGGNTIVTIAATDKGFSSSGCGTWVKQ